MQYRKLGWTDLELSEIGFGAWAIGGEGTQFSWGPQDDTLSVKAIKAAIESGINWIDTAAVYGLGHSETVVAKAVEGIRSEVIIATKCSRVWDKDGNITSSLTRESIFKECDESLKRLNTDYIDLYQIHWPGDKEHLEEGWIAIGELIESGMVRYAGVSNFAQEEMELLQKHHRIASVQPPYSMMRRKVEEQFDFLKSNQIGVVAYSPMQAGLLTGKFDKTRIHPNDWRNNSPEFNEPNLSVNLWFVDELRNIANKYNKSVAQLALAWTLRTKVLTSAIAGARNPDQSRQNVGGSGFEIEIEDQNLIEELLRERINRVAKVGGLVRT